MKYTSYDEEGNIINSFEERKELIVLPPAPMNDAFYKNTGGLSIKTDLERMRIQHSQEIEKMILKGRPSTTREILQQEITDEEYGIFASYRDQGFAGEYINKYGVEKHSRMLAKDESMKKSYRDNMRKLAKLTQLHNKIRGGQHG